MAFAKISEQELGAVGVELLDDQPEMQPDAMKAKFEETAKQLLAPKHNTLVEQLEAETAAASLGAAVPTGLSAQTAKTVQAVLAALMVYIQAHEKKDDNPHDVTATQTGAYTKAETDSAINEKVVQIGAGDMAKATYDPQNKGADIFAYADLKMDKATYDPQNKGADIFAYADLKMAKATYDPQNKAQDVFAYPTHVYVATFLVDEWEGDGPYTQTVAVEKYNGGPDVTEHSVMLPGMGVDDTIQGESADILKEAAAIVDGGTKTFDSNTITCVVQEKPTADAEVYFCVMKGGA